MLILITGGASSGKSPVAENIAIKYGKNIAYIATMMRDCKEALAKIEKHKKQREEKPFKTIECFKDINSISLANFDTAILECLPTLLSNEMFKKENVICEPSQKIYENLKNIKNKINNFIIVTNNVFSDGSVYDKYTEYYMKSLACLNLKIANISDIIIETTVGIPVYIKGDKII